MIWFLFVLLFFGLIFGAIARLVVPGPDPMSLGATWLLGVVGSFTGGLLGSVIFGIDSDDGVIQLGGIVGSIIGSIVVLLIARTVMRGRAA